MDNYGRGTGAPPAVRIQANYEMKDTVNDIVEDIRATSSTSTSSIVSA